MLKKVIYIKNVGKFRRAASARGEEFKRVVLIFAPNAQGKTTFCDIMRSLRDDDGDAIVGRKALGAEGEPEAKLLFADGAVTFADGSWSKANPRVQVFDERFVYSNVHAGESVEHEQRRNLHDVIIGEKGVALRKRVDELDVELRSARQVAAGKLEVVEAFVPEDSVTTKLFLALNPDDGIETKIEDASRRVSALEKASDVKAMDVLAPLDVTWHPYCVEQLLRTTIDDVGKSAEERVRAHFASHLQEPDEAWVVRGVGLVNGDRCPLCAQSIDGNEMLQAYRVLFGDEYKGLRKRITSMRSAVEAVGGESDLRAMEKVMTTNARLLREWREYATLDFKLELDVDALEGALKEYQQAALEQLGLKESSPLDVVAVGERLRAALEAVESARKLVEDYNLTVSLVNNELKRTKDEMDAGELPDAKAAFGKAEATRVRHTEGCADACAEYREAEKRRKELDLEKKAARVKLDEYSSDVFERYQDSINELLKKFSAGFRIGKTQAEFPGGKPRSKYCLVIDGKEVELGDAKTPRTKASFKNTLSAGDKSALALAFFLAQLEEMDTLSEQVVVFDDPFTSQDRARQFWTKHEIADVAAKAAQVIVLSHSQTFLRQVWGVVSNAVSIQFSGLGDTAIADWDVDSVTDAYFELYATVYEYCYRNKGDAREVAPSLRKLLEGHLRHKLPFEFDESGNLGSYVREIEKAEAGTPKAMAKPLLPKLTKLNDFSVEHHHFERRGGPEEQLDAREVQTLGTLALSVVEGF